MTTFPDGLRVVELTAENFKRLTAVQIAPDPDSPTVVIGGRNAQGKSSVLDAIWSAIRGAEASKSTGTTRAVRDGAESATVRVDLGELVVTRKWAGEKSTLTVTSADGAKYGSPQKMLDDLVGSISFDPLAFTRERPAVQAAQLGAIVGLSSEMASLASRRDALFGDRTEVGRRLKTAEGAAQSIKAEIGGEDVPGEPVNVSALVERRDAIISAQRAREIDFHAREIHRQNIDAWRAEIAELEDNIAKSLAEIEDLTTTLDGPHNGTTEAELAEVAAAIEGAQDHDRRYRLGVSLADAAAEVEKLASERQGLTAAIDGVDQERRDLLAAAEFPVDGLGFDADGQVTFNGVPFSQASSAEQLRVSVGMAMAANPRLRVIRIADGSLLDDESMAVVADMAADGGFQVWIERVGDPGEVGILIEDGQVAR